MQDAVVWIDRLLMDDPFHLICNARVYIAVSGPVSLVRVSRPRVPRFQFPAGEFRCVDFAHSDLVAALRFEGGGPERTGAITFLLDMQSTSETQPRTENIGAVMHITIKESLSIITICSGLTKTRRRFPQIDANQRVGEAFALCCVLHIPREGELP